MENESKLRPHLSVYAIWALSLGTTIGWGSLVVTSNTYLSQAGPLGSVLGLLLGAAVMLVISRNYHYLINCFPDAGGAYAFSRETFGCDHGFLTAWFLMLTYLAMLWANATSLPLFARYFIGNLFRFGYLYTIFGYDVYLGETLLTIAAILLIALLCMRRSALTWRLLVGLAVVFCLGILACFIAAMAGHKGSFSPALIPEKSALTQVIRIACISPWAFIGFENISHLTEEFAFPRQKTFRVMAGAVGTSTLLYVSLLLLSVSAYPARYDSWLDYIRDIGNLSGIEGLPPFYAARHYLGDAGVWILMAVLLALVLTSLIGNITALSRLFYALGKDEVFPAAVGRLDKNNIPGNAILLIAAVSMLVPFLGRTAIGWIVDVTTIGATLIYGFVSAAALKMARIRSDLREKVTGAFGLVVMIGFGAYLLLPNLFSSNTMEAESFLLFVVWSVLGFLFFHFLLRRDRHGKFGKSIVVWVGLLSLVLFISLVWLNQSTMTATERVVRNIQEYYISTGLPATEQGFISGQLDDIRRANIRSIITVIVMFGFSVGVLLNNFSLMRRRVQESEAELLNVRTMANTDPLTGVKSKQAYIERERAINEAIIRGGQEPFSVVICDLNGLKAVNDSRGHKAGDEYIRAAARMICDVFLHSAVFRIGGDEFLVLLTGRDYDRQAQLMGEIHGQSVANIGLNGVVVAAGISAYDPAKDRTVRDVFERADALMYAEKKSLKAMGAVTR